jgi:hypothetical protein
MTYSSFSHSIQFSHKDRHRHSETEVLQHDVDAVFVFLLGLGSDKVDSDHLATPPEAAQRPVQARAKLPYADGCNVAPNCGGCGAAVTFSKAICVHFKPRAQQAAGSITAKTSTATTAEPAP